MTDDTKKDRSPHHPKQPLEAAIELVRKLYSKTGKAKVNTVVAANALGYSGLNGAALGTIGTITQYGLVDRERGSTIGISPLALQIIHPLSPEQEAQAKRTAALSPRVFNDLFTRGFHLSSEDVVANNLIHSGFTPDGAKKAASVFKANVEFVKLDSEDNTCITSNSPVGSTDREPSGFEMPATNYQSPHHPKQQPAAARTEEPRKRGTRFLIPLLDKEATLEFMGDEPPTDDDFDSVIEMIEVMKKQFKRKLQAEKTDRQLLGQFVDPVASVE